MSGYRRRGAGLANRLAVARAQRMWASFEQQQDAAGNLIVTQDQLDQMAQAFWGEPAVPDRPGLVSSIVGAIEADQAHKARTGEQLDLVDFIAACDAAKREPRR